MNSYVLNNHGFPIRHAQPELELPKLLRLLASMFGPATKAVFIRAYQACMKFLKIKIGKYIYRFTSMFLTYDQQSSLMHDNTLRYPDLRRSLFHSFSFMSLILVSKNHSHPDSAVLRSSMTAKMESEITKAGYCPYSISPSAREAYDGARCYYSPKDLAVPFKFDEINDNHVIMLIDIDYYVDMNAILRTGQPILLYTFVPATVTGRTTEQSWHIEDDEVSFFVTGGSEYRHKLWNYSGDTIEIIADDLSLIVYSLEQKQLDKDPNRRLISILPKTRTKFPYYLPLNFQDGITRTKFLFGNVNVIYDSIKDNLSIAKNGDKFGVEVKGKTLHAIEKRLNNKTTAPLASDIERMLGDDIEDKPETASMLIELIGTKFNRNYFTSGTINTNYQSTVGSTIEDGKTTEIVMMDSLLTNPAVYPVRSYNNDLAMIAGRIEKPRNVAEPKKAYNDFAKEFSYKLLNSNEHSLHPITIAQVNEIQNKPTQRARSELVMEIMDSNFKVKLKPFQKSEGYAAANSPRNITSLNAEATLVFSSFTYPFKWAILKKCPWYSPGLTPIEVERKLSTMKGDLIATDFSRFDGSISKWLQNRIVRTNYTIAFHSPDDKDLLYRKFNEMHFAKAKTGSGVWYDPGYGTKSGSPFTTDGNTMINAFVNYSALRTLGLENEEAWASLGLYCGDDGLIVDRPGLQTALLTVCQDLGLAIECIQIGDMKPIPYCGRYFIRADLECFSFCDPLRTLGKFHLTSNKNVDKTQALVNKALGYAATDRNTPILSALITRIFDLHGNISQNMLPEEEYRMNNSWTQVDKDTILPYFIQVSGLDREVIDLLEKDILKSDLQVIAHKIHNEVKHKIPAVIGDNIVGPVPTKRIKYTNKRNLMQNNDVNESIGIPAISGGDAQAISHPHPNDNEGLPKESGCQGQSSTSARTRGKGRQRGQPKTVVGSNGADGVGSNANDRAPKKNHRTTPTRDEPKSKPSARGAQRGSSKSDRTLSGHELAIRLMEAAGIDWKKDFTLKSSL